MLVEKICPRCGFITREHRNPVPTVDIIIEYQDRGVVLVKRGKPPWGWALPGGFVDYGETLEEAARREAREETGLEVKLLGQFHAYSDPQRDPRQHAITMVFVARGYGVPLAGDDAGDLAIFSPENPPEPMAFDHARILADYAAVRRQWLEK
ncbi:MAG: NUDIX hydrolase [Deltaproteobacteria bacterium]|nr:NUDIX hydrolase [Deltaproteobacteria bacterium]